MQKRGGDVWQKGPLAPESQNGWKKEDMQVPYVILVQPEIYQVKHTLETATQT
jgi:hypothetical protein